MNRETASTTPRPLSASPQDQETERAPKPPSIREEFDLGDGPGPQTESSKERGFNTDDPERKKAGRSDAIDPDGTGDIADEGTGRRG
jgi:hypothetical protein